MQRIRPTGKMIRVFVNSTGDLASVLGQIIPKTKKCYLMPP